jgi:hypothetical protein
VRSNTGVPALAGQAWLSRADDRHVGCGMNLNDLLISKGFSPSEVLALRHRPHEPQLTKVLPWLAAEKPDLFNAYQQNQGPVVEKSMSRAAYVASFIGHGPGKALFIDLRLRRWTNLFGT